MTKRTVKTLNKTGRVSRKKASAAASTLRQSLPKRAKTVKISKATTASGRAKIAFHVSDTITVKVAIRDSKETKSEQRQSA